jgi:hypothetical protein
MILTAKRTAAIVALLLVGFASSVVRANPCAEVFDRLFPDSANPTVRYVQNEAGNDITYGLEGELNVSKAPGLLEWYRPRNKTDEQWFAMSQEERVSAAGRGSGMVKTGRAPEWLHESLSSDPGGAEFMTKPTDKLEEAMGWISTVEQQLGQDRHGRSRVYWQGNVAYKREGDFSRTNRDGILGYVKATGDYAQFGKLHKGYEVHMQNPEFIPGKNLGHANLPPVNTSHVRNMEGELTAASDRRRASGYSHYIQGTYFRTWPYPDRNGFEVRDAHKDVKILRREMKRLTHGLEKGFAPYEAFKSVTMTDESAHFAKFSQPVQTLLNKLSYGKRYALPMRPFENEYPTALGLQGQAAEAFRNRVTSARNQFVQTLETLAANNPSMERAELTNKVRVALSKFAYDSGIYTTLDSHFSGIGQR